MKSILEKYQSAEVGINLSKAFNLEKATLTSVHEEYFSIMGRQGSCLHHFPYSAIVQLIENPDGVQVGGFLQHKECYALVIKVGHLVEYVPV